MEARARLPVHRLTRSLSVGAVALLAAACQDLPTDPVAGLVAAETGGALVVEAELPSPASLGVPEGDEGAAAVARWRESWALPVEPGRARRALLYEPLVDALGEPEPASVAAAVSSLGSALGSVLALGTESLSPDLRASLRNAETLHRRAVRALEVGDLREAVSDVLRGSDALREVGPRAVARSMIADAEAALRRILEGGTYSEVDVERSRRLLRGARSALEAEDFARSIRRAYYARRLLISR